MSKEMLASTTRPRRTPASARARTTIGARTSSSRRATCRRPLRCSVSPSSGVFPLPVIGRRVGSTDTDATPIASYSFDFGDGSAVVGPQAGATATHTYSAAGTYAVTVTVTDTGGRSSIDDARSVTVNADLRRRARR